MAVPWSHWPDPTGLPVIAAHETPEERTKRQQETDAKLHSVVKVSLVNLDCAALTGESYPGLC